MAAVAQQGEQSFFPISEISTYHAKWVIRARVTMKGVQRSFNGRDGKSGQVFNIQLLDESGSEISASFFGPVAEMYFPKIEQGKCYPLTGGSVRIANRQYNRCNHRYEIVFDRNAQVEEVADIAMIETVKYTFTDLHALQNKTMPFSADICGVITSVKPVVSFTSKDGKDLTKREITVADDTSTSIIIALWGERAKQEDKIFEGNPVICLKGVLVREFNGGRSGSLMEAGALDMTPKFPEAERVRAWWSQSGASTNLTNISSALSSNREGLMDLKTLSEKTLPCAVDLCGVVVSFRPIFSFTSKEGKELVKREITIADDSALSMSVTVWGDRAKQDDKLFEGNPVVFIQGVLVKEWNGGRSGSLLEAGSLTFKPETPEGQKVQQWWSAGGSSQSIGQLSQEGGGGTRGPAANAKPATVAEMRQASETVGAEVQVFNVPCRLALVQTTKKGEMQPLYYLACQEPRAGTTLLCNKRVSEDGFCAACNRLGKNAPRLNLRCRFSDFADSAWLTTFHEPAQGLLKTTAEEIRALETGGGGRDAVEAILRQKYFMEPLLVTVRAKMDSYNGEQKTNITCVDAQPLQRGPHGRALLKNIREMIGMLSDTGLMGGA
mmetsp:Transcript_73887/g.211912  ORF Transcript_73887/g.211912 Transcript_73887/m.211912 type:complete len:609 (+) Transcript_73887:88-1914(+)